DAGLVDQAGPLVDRYLAEDPTSARLRRLRARLDLAAAAAGRGGRRLGAIPTTATRSRPTGRSSSATRRGWSSATTRSCRRPRSTTWRRRRGAGGSPTSGGCAPVSATAATTSAACAAPTAR